MSLSLGVAPSIPSTNSAEFISNTNIIEPQHAAVIDVAKERLSSGLRSLLLFGSCLSPDTRREGSIPDLFAIVDNVDAALARLGAGIVARRASPFLPPTTVSLCSAYGSAKENSSPAAAKLNLIEPRVLERSIQTLPDLYLAGRLSKRSILLHARDPACEREIAALIAAASSAVATAALLAPPRRFPLDSAVRHCFELSYMAEIRPETQSALRARFDAFASFYADRFIPLLSARALKMGLSTIDDVFIDERPLNVRRAEDAELAALLRRSRLRSIGRWPKQALVYRGWAAYLAAKIRRSRAD